MAKTAHGRTGVTMNLTPDSKHGVVTQDPESMLGTMGGIGDVLGDIAVGIPVKIVTRLGAASFVATGSALDFVSNVFAKDCPHKLRLLEVAFQMQEFTAGDWGGTGVLDLKVEHGDGAASESFNEIMADFDLEDVYLDGEGAVIAPTATAPLVPAYQTIDVNESLRVTLTELPDATAAAVWIDAILTVMRVN